jgi:DNA-binding transcriptional LysR family regulator
MQTFVAVATHRSFAGAARALGLSTSAVSKHIRNLEDRLGVQLLNRTTRQVVPTEAGELFLERSRGLLEEVDELEAQVRGVQAEPRGTLRITTPHDFGRLILCDVLAAFVGEHPELRVELDLTDRLVDIVEEGFDVALRIAQPSDSTLRIRRLSPIEMCLCASPAYLERYGVPERPADLRTHNCIEYAHLAASGWRFRSNGRSETVVATGRLHSTSGWAMRVFALADHGIALLPLFMIREDLEAGRLQTLLADQLDHDNELAAMLPPGRQVPAKTRAFLDFVAERLSAEPWWQTPG